MMATDVADPRAWQCSIYWLGRGGGRCARGGGRTERHHVVKRSEPEQICEHCGGSGFLDADQIECPCPDCDEQGRIPRPTTDICLYCHRQIERQIEPFTYRVELPSGEFVHVEAPTKRRLNALLGKLDDEGCLSDSEFVGQLTKQVWPKEGWHDPSFPRHWRVGRLWENCGDELEAESIKGMDELATGIEIYRQGAWRTAQALYRLEALGDGWRLHGYESVGELAFDAGLKPQTLTKYLAAERTLHEAPGINPEQAARIRKTSMELMVSARSQIARLNTNQIDKVLAVAETAPVKEAVREAKTIANVNEAAAVGYKHATVTLVSKAATFVLEIPYLDGEDVIRKAQLAVQNDSAVNVIEWADRKQQGWEETKP